MTEAAVFVNGKYVGNIYTRPRNPIPDGSYVVLYTGGEIMTYEVVGGLSHGPFYSYSSTGRMTARGVFFRDVVLGNVENMDYAAYPGRRVVNLIDYPQTEQYVEDMFEVLTHLPISKEAERTIIREGTLIILRSAEDPIPRYVLGVIRRAPSLQATIMAEEDDMLNSRIVREPEHDGDGA
jgi:hypothetical protein